MKDRGEDHFVRLPALAARLYDRLTQAKALQCQRAEIAADLLSRISHGRLLDVGTGPGRLLVEIHRRNPDIELYGLDVSAAMVAAAKQHLSDIPAAIRQGNIERTEYESDFFDLITCTGSFYLWNRPEMCIQEIHRVLRVGATACLYETYQDFNADEVRKAVRANLRGEGLLRRLFMPHFLMKQLQMTYRTDEYAAIIQRTSFSKSHRIEKITLAGLPAWLRITLTK
jgi:ubiquinone/menaquinone biosynthesis C-methylase UbiE